MKSNKDYKNSIDRKAKQIIYRRKLKRHFVTWAACFGLMVCAAITISVLIRPVVYKDTVMFSTNTDGESLSNTAQASNVHMNPIIDNAEASLLYFDPAKTHRETWDWDQISLYLGRDITPAYIPAGLIESPYSKEQSVILNNDGTIAYDAIWLEYYTEYEDDGSQVIGGNSSGIRITVSKAGYSESCGVYVWPQDMKETVLNGVPVKFGFRQMAWGGTAENPESYYDLYVAEFDKNSISYQVISSNITEDEFVKTVDSLTKQ